MNAKKIASLLIAAVWLPLAVQAAGRPAETAGTEQTSVQTAGRKDWWRHDRFGMFIHYGLYSQLGGYWNGQPVSGIGEWIFKIGKIPVADYHALAKTFTGTAIDADAWVKLAKDTGMKYLVVTAKHHDGFALFKSKVDPFNIVDATPYGKDLIAQIVDACHKYGIKIGLYYSQFQDWSFPGAGGNDWEEGYGYTPEGFEKYMEQKALPQVRELLTNYGKIDMIWYDTPGKMTKAQSEAFLNLAKELQPGIIVSGRVGNDVGDYVQMEDNNLPSTRMEEDWEVPVTMNHTWAYKKDDHHWKSVPYLLWQLTYSASMGGNYLLNIGPKGDGSVPEESIERLSEIGKWMQHHSETIYGTEPSPFPTAFDWGGITVKGSKMFLNVTDWPEDGRISLYGLRNEVKSVKTLVGGRQVPFYENEGYVNLDLSGLTPEKYVSTLVMEVEGKPEAEQVLVQNYDGRVVLEAESAKNETGVKIRFGTVNRWFKPQGQLSWNFLLKKPGRYQVEVITTGYKRMAYPELPAFWDGGHRIKMNIGGQELEGIVDCDRKEAAPHDLYNDFKISEMGEVEIHEAGPVSISLQPISIVKKNTAGLAVRMVRLVPADPEAAVSAMQGKYEPTWDSIDARPVPQWYSDAKFGIFIHWGLYSVPGYTSKGTYAEWYWNALNEDPEKANAKRLERHLAITDFHHRVYGKDFPYSGFRDGFRAELFNPDEWADIFQRSGARYVVLTSKHHDGYCLWPNREASRSYGMPWNTMESGPHRDLLGELTDAVRKTDLKMGLYYSIWDWYNPLWTEEQQNRVKSGSMAVDFKQKEKKAAAPKKDPAKVAESKAALSNYIHQVMYPQFKELVRNYSPSLIFSDGDWWMSDKLWETKPLLAWLYNNAPNADEVVINDRWGKGRGKHGGYFTTEYGSGFDHADRPWEENRGIGMSFGINRIENIDDYNTAQELLFMLVDIVSRGGNLLLNIGPNPDGTIPVIMQERLLQIGNWLDVNGEAIYGTRPYKVTAQWSEGKQPVFTKDDYHAGFPIFEMTLHPKEGNARKEMWFTRKGDDLYALLPAWPEDEVVVRDVTLPKHAAVTLLGYDQPLQWKARKGQVRIDLSKVKYNDIPCRHIFVLKLEGGAKE